MNRIQKYYKKGIISLILFSLISTVSRAHFGYKGIFGGSVSCSTINDTTVYLGTFTGGVYESINSKLAGWRARPVGLKSGKITALTHSGKYLFAGTADSGIYIFNGYVNTDRYWNKINTGLTNLKIKSLVAVDSITILAGTDGGGIYKTTDKGANWVAINNNSLNTAVITGLVKAGNRIILTSLNGGVYASNDKGDTWIDFNDSNTLAIAGTVAASYNNTTDELLVVNNNGIYKASTASSTTVPIYLSSQTGVPANTLVHSISNDNTNWYLATDKGVFTSIHTTINWTSQNTGLTTMNTTAICAFQTNLILGTINEGIFTSPVNTISWLANNTGFNNLITYSITSTDKYIVVAATEKGVFVSTDLATNYVRANKGLIDSLNVTDLTFLGANLYAATKNNGVFISADTGKNWLPFNSGLMANSLTKIIATANNLFTFTATGEVYQLTGNAWTLMQNGLPTGIVPTAIIGYGKNFLLSTAENGVFIRTENHPMWMMANTGLTNLNTTSLSTLGSNIFVGTNGSGVFISDTLSINWKPVSKTSISHTILMGLDGTKIQAMGSYLNFIFASYTGGVLATSDNGVTWIAAGTQFNLPSYTAVNKFSFVTTRIFVTTENNCAYSNGLAELPEGIKEYAMDKIGSFKINPNPCNGNFNINLSDIKGTLLKIVIYDNLGKLIKVVDKNLWQQTITLQPISGIYYIKIYTDKGVASQKIILK